MWYKNKLTEILKIKYPIIQAGMAGGVTSADLVAQVSECGGLGSIGAGYMSAAQLRAAVREVKELTDKPFMVNLFVPEAAETTEDAVGQANERLQSFYKLLDMEPAKIPLKNDVAVLEEQVAVVIEEQVPICGFTFGIPDSHLMQRLKENKISLLGTATTVEEARLNEAAGMDIIVAQGSEAGGHRGTFHHEDKDAMIGTMSLIPQVADHVTIPVVAAGGIMDGRGILAALTLGAEAVQMGTAFLTTEESGANPLHKEIITESSEDNIAVTKGFSGKAARGVKNEFIEKTAGHEGEFLPYPLQNSLTSPLRKEAAKQKRTELMSLWAGQSPRLSKQQTVKTLMENLIEEIEQTIQHQKRFW
ncbi:MAG TPA: nitronate monooxygenase [Pseudogracilibacillus sp.]|nr:nitronate monooxygenase [Pseudogracilibacillus sp.]